MKKKEIAKAVSEKLGVQQSQAEEIISLAFDEIISALKNNQDVLIFGFGKFSTRKYNVRKCYNPITGEVNSVDASVQPVFKAGKLLRDALNK